MAWVDPATMSDSDIEAELGEVAVKLGEALEAGGKIAELEGRQWRLRFEQRFRRRGSDDTRRNHQEQSDGYSKTADRGC
jgi:hypothetical protein